MVFALLGVPKALLYAFTSLGPVWDRFGIDLGPQNDGFVLYGPTFGLKIGDNFTIF